MKEQVQGIIDHTEGKGNTRTMKKWALVLTSNRVLDAKISGTVGVALSGLSGVIGDAGRSDIHHRVDELSTKISEISIEDLLHEDQDNFMIPYPEITKTHARLLSPTSFRFITSNKTYSFNLINRKEFRKHVEMIKTILPNKS
jgi:hypothetical protein